MSDVAALLPGYIGAAVLLVAGLLAYGRFLRARPEEHAVDIDVDLQFVGVQASQSVVQVTARLENTSLVRRRYWDLAVTIRYLTAHDELADGDATAHYELRCPRTIDERIGGQQRRLADAGHLDPRQRARHTYVTYLPSDAAFALVRCEVITAARSGAGRRRADAVVASSQRIYRVPSAACRGRLCGCDRGVVI